MQRFLDRWSQHHRGLLYNITAPGQDVQPGEVLHTPAGNRLRITERGVAILPMLVVSQEVV